MNQLNASPQPSIVALVARGWLQRRIARELGLDRATVTRYTKPADSKPATGMPSRPGGRWSMQIKTPLWCGLFLPTAWQEGAAHFERQILRTHPPRASDRISSPHKNGE